MSGREQSSPSVESHSNNEIKPTYTVLVNVLETLPPVYLINPEWVRSAQSVSVCSPPAKVSCWARHLHLFSVHLSSSHVVTRGSS